MTLWEGPRPLRPTVNVCSGPILHKLSEDTPQLDMLKVLGGLRRDKTPTSWSCVPVGETMSNQARLIQTETHVMRIRGNGAELLNCRNAVDRQMDG